MGRLIPPSPGLTLRIHRAAAVPARAVSQIPAVNWPPREPSLTDGIHDDLVAGLDQIHANRRAYPADDCISKGPLHRFSLPSAAMMCSQTCGLVHSYSLTTPSIRTVLLRSNMAR